MNAALSNCCEEHLAEFEAELLRHLRECVAQQQGAEAAADEEPAPSSVQTGMPIIRRCTRCLVIAGICSLAAAAPTMAADAFDGAYTGKRVLTKSSGPACPTDDDVSVTIHGGALTFTDSALHDYSIGFDPRPDGSFSLISTGLRGAGVLIQGRIVGDVLDADVTNGPCDYHWHLTKNPP